MMTNEDHKRIAEDIMGWTVHDINGVLTYDDDDITAATLPKFDEPIAALMALSMWINGDRRFIMRGRLRLGGEKWIQVELRSESMPWNNCFGVGQTPEEAIANALAEWTRP